MLDRLANIPDYHLGRLVLTAPDRMLCLAPHPDGAVALAAGAPYGGGYFVGTWNPGPPR